MRNYPLSRTSHSINREINTRAWCNHQKMRAPWDQGQESHVLSRPFTFAGRDSALLGYLAFFSLWSLCQTVKLLVLAHSLTGHYHCPFIDRKQTHNLHKRAQDVPLTEFSPALRCIFIALSRTHLSSLKRRNVPFSMARPWCILLEDISEALPISTCLTVD